MHLVTTVVESLLETSTKMLDTLREWASTIANSARMSGDIQDSFTKSSNACPCGPDGYYCELPGDGCVVHPQQEPSRIL